MFIFFKFWVSRLTFCITTHRDFSHELAQSFVDAKVEHARQKDIY
jgi:hypothetical protein